MTGHVLAYSVQTNAGAISGDDGNRYTFTGADWRISGPPQRGMRVDFDPNGNAATGIYQAMPANPPTPAPGPAVAASNNAMAAGNSIMAAGSNAITTVSNAVATAGTAVAAPASVDFEFASPPRRIGAWLFDTLVLIFTLGIGFLIWLVIAAVLRRPGQSPGKALFGIQVVRRDGSPPGFGLMLGRFLCRFFVSYVIPLANIVSFVMMLSDQRRRALHDHMAGTLVVRRR